MNTWGVLSQHVRFSKNLARLMGAKGDDIEDPAKRVNFLRSVDSKAMTDRLFEVYDEEVNKQVKVTQKNINIVVSP